MNSALSDDNGGMAAKKSVHAGSSLFPFFLLSSCATSRDRSFMWRLSPLLMSTHLVPITFSPVGLSMGSHTPMDLITSISSMRAFLTPSGGSSLPEFSS